MGDRLGEQFDGAGLADQCWEKRFSGHGGSAMGRDRRKKNLYPVCCIVSYSVGPKFQICIDKPCKKQKRLVL